MLQKQLSDTTTLCLANWNLIVLFSHKSSLCCIFKVLFIFNFVCACMYMHAHAHEFMCMNMNVCGYEVRDTGFLACIIQGFVSHQILENRAKLDPLQKRFVLLATQPYLKLPLCYFYSMLKMVIPHNIDQNVFILCLY